MARPLPAADHRFFLKAVLIIGLQTYTYRFQLPAILKAMADRTSAAISVSSRKRCQLRTLTRKQKVLLTTLAGVSRNDIPYRIYIVKRLEIRFSPGCLLPGQ